MTLCESTDEAETWEPENRFDSGCLEEFRKRDQATPAVDERFVGRAPALVEDAKRHLAEGMPGLLPRNTQHLRGTLNSPGRFEGGSREIQASGLPHDLILAYLNFETADVITSRRRAGGGHGVGGEEETFGAHDLPNGPKHRGGQVNSIRDETGRDPFRIEHAPDDIIVPVQVLGHCVAEVGDGHGACLNGGVQLLSGSVCVPQTNGEILLHSRPDEINGSAAFGGDG